MTSILLFVCLLSGPATDDKHSFDCLLVVSTINLLGSGRTKNIVILGQFRTRDLSRGLSEWYNRQRMYCISKVSKFLGSSVISFGTNFSDGFIWNPPHAVDV